MRPSWHLDAKWLSALATVFLLFAASISYTLHRLTDHDTASGEEPSPRADDLPSIGPGGVPQA